VILFVILLLLLIHSVADASYSVVTATLSTSSVFTDSSFCSDSTVPTDSIAFTSLFS
jgi:hypothetical protein